MSSEYVAERFTHNGYRVQIIQDSDAHSPDEYGDDGVFIVTTKNRHFQLLHNGMDAHECMEDKELTKKYWTFPVFAYIHSGVALSLGRGGQFSDPWDSGQIGFVFCAKSEWKYRTRDTKRCSSAHTFAKGYVKEWNQYLSGDVWGYVIEQPNGEHVDSCWGFYGLDYCKQEAISCVPAEPATNAEECEELEDSLA